jgi:N-hydroxyarylamine O-acetyltransferase
MQATNFDLQKYLNRIRYEGKTEANFQTLSGLMKHQLCSVPFENIDVEDGKIVSLKPEDIVEKIVEQKRGGYCYELNGLFCMALEKIGFKYKMLAARPMFNYSQRRPKTHMVLAVAVEDEEWICDLGYGGYGLREPVSIDKLGIGVQQGDDEFLLTQVTATEYLLQIKIDGKWTELYSFEPHQQEWVDYTLANYFNSTSPDTIFTKKRLSIIQKPSGRVFLVDDELKIIDNGATLIRVVPKEDRSAVLKEYFGIDKK